MLVVLIAVVLREHVASGGHSIEWSDLESHNPVGAAEMPGQYYEILAHKCTQSAMEDEKVVGREEYTMLVLLSIQLRRCNYR